MNDDTWISVVVVGIVAVVISALGFSAIADAKPTSTTTQQAKVIAIEGETIALESPTTRFNLYSDGGTSPKVGETVTVQINKHKHSEPDYIVKGYPSISAEKPGDDDDMVPFFMPMATR